MTISLVGSITKASATNGGDATVTLPSGMQQGDVVYCLCGLSLNRGGGTSSSGWTQIGSTLDALTTVRLQIWRKIMGATPDTSFVLTGSANTADSSSVIAIALRGVDQTTPEDGVTPSTASANSAALDAASVTPTTTNAWAIAYAVSAVVDTSGIGAPSGYSNLTSQSSSDSNSTTSYAATKGSLTGGTPENPGGFSGGTSAPWGAMAMIVKPAPPPTGRSYGVVMG